MLMKTGLCCSEELERKDEYCLEFKRKEIENHKEEIRKLKMDNKLLELKQQKLRDRVVFLHKQLQTNRADKLMALNFSKSLNKVEGTSVLGSNNLTTGFVYMQSHLHSCRICTPILDERCSFLTDCLNSAYCNICDFKCIL